MKHDPAFDEQLKEILERESAFDRDAYYFVRDAVSFAHKRKARTGSRTSVHVNCVELMDGFRCYALQQFGPLAFQVLNSWGIQTTMDVGNIVFLMIGAGIFRASDEDNLEAFRDVFDLQEVLLKPYTPTGKDVSIPQIDGDA